MYYYLQGRTSNNNIRLKDISVSRHHCNLSIDKGKLYIENKGSKFGTLLYLQSKYKLMRNKEKLTLISGSYCINIEMELKWSLLSLFSCCKIKSNLNNKEVDLTVRDNEYTPQDQIQNMNNSQITLSNIHDLNTINDKKKRTIQEFEDSLIDIVLNIENILQIKDKNEKQLSNTNSFI